MGHGTMCAVIAAGTRSAGGRFEGVAPEAGVFAARTRFFDSELAAIYDHLAGGRPRDCHPNTIWNYKSREDVFVVGACDLEGQIWSYSSRGPGQNAAAPGHAPKPDLVAPTPAGGLVAFGLEDRVFAEGWGTSGACPQAAGLAALLWTAEPGLSVSELFARIRSGAGDLGLAPTCQGAGRLDCGAARWRNQRFGDRVSPLTRQESGTEEPNED